MLCASFHLKGLFVLMKAYSLPFVLLNLLMCQSCSCSSSRSREEAWRISFLGQAGQFLNVPKCLSAYPLVQMNFYVSTKASEAPMGLEKVVFRYDTGVHVFNLSHVENAWQLDGLSGEWQDLKGNLPPCDCPLGSLERGTLFFILAEEKEVPCLAESLKEGEEPTAPFLIVDRENFRHFLYALSKAKSVHLTFVGKNRSSCITLGPKLKKMAGVASQLLNRYRY